MRVYIASAMIASVLFLLLDGELLSVLGILLAGILTWLVLSFDYLLISVAERSHAEA